MALPAPITSSTHAMRRRSIGEDILLETAFEESLWAVEADPGAVVADIEDDVPGQLLLLPEVEHGLGLHRRQGSGLDLVEVSPNANPPVCKIMDYGRYKYELTKKQHEAKKKQSTFQIKEIKYFLHFIINFFVFFSFIYF